MSGEQDPAVSAVRSGHVEPEVVIDGVGVVGGRLARELVSSHRGLGVELHARSPHRRTELAKAFGGDATVHDSAAGIPESARVVVLAGDQGGQAEAAAEHLEAGRHVVTVGDRPEVTSSLLVLDSRARSADRTLVVGAGFSPGLSGLLAARLAEDFEVVDELHYARHGAAGRLCAADRLGALRRRVPVWHDREWVDHRPGSGRELCWFPDPIGGADAYRAATAEPLLAVAAFDSLRRCSARLVLSRWDRMVQHLPVLLPAPAEGGVGALRVEMRGSIDGSRATRVLGTLDRPGVVAAALGAEVVSSLLGGSVPTGAFGLEKWPDPGEMLVRLRDRGVRTAALG